MTITAGEVRSLRTARDRVAPVRETATRSRVRAARKRGQGTGDAR